MAILKREAAVYVVGLLTFTVLIFVVSAIAGQIG